MTTLEIKQAYDRNTTEQDVMDSIMCLDDETEVEEEFPKPFKITITVEAL